MVPLLVLQATNDHVVPKLFTDQTVAELCHLGGNVTYHSYTVKNMSGTAPAHRGTMDLSLSDATHWAASRFAGKTGSSTCPTSQAGAK
jgi:hypothetical protein